MVPSRSTPSTQSHVSAGMSANVAPLSTRALFHTTCTAPNASIVWAASASTSSSRDTSVRTPTTSPPVSRSSETAVSSAPASTSARTTFIPSCTKRSANARPMPLAAPVTTATFPSSCSTCSSSGSDARTRILSSEGMRDTRRPVPAADDGAPPRDEGPRMTSTLAIETHGLGKRFGERTALESIDLEVPRGHAFGFLGPNGAGKTTLIRMLLGLARPTSGQIRLLGHDLPHGRAAALARVGAIIEEPRFHPHLTGAENLHVHAAARDRAAHDRVDGALERVGLARRGGDRVGTYSLGMRQRLGLARRPLCDPLLLLLEEPVNGLDPAGILEFRHLIRGLVDEGRTVLLSSHLLDEVQKTCDIVAIVDDGRVVAQGPIHEIVRGGPRAIDVVAHSAVEAATLLAAVPGVTRATDHEGALRVHLSPEAPVDREIVTALLRRLLDHGVAVERIAPVRSSLEDRFLTMTTRLEDRS